MINISTLLDPRYVFLIYAPILFAVNKRVGHRMVLALTLAEWANQILKWLLAGERPYWYVHERANELRGALGQSSDSVQPASSDGLALGQLNASATDSSELDADGLVASLRQFPVTCELGAGSPSGHAMVTATVWYILIDAYLKGELPLLGRVNYASIRARQAASRKEGDQQQRGDLAETNWSALARLSWSLYTLMLVAVSLSRVYLACHFPHQCLCGALLGALTARLVAEQVPMESLRKRHFATLTGFMFSSALATYALLRLSGFDPLWSVSKGMRWCISPDYIHLDTTPFFSMMRYLGFCLGCGLAYDASKVISGNNRAQAEEEQHLEASDGSSEGGNRKQSGNQNQMLLLRRVVGAALAIAFGQFLLSLPAPRSNMNLFYLISFLIYTLFSYSIAGPIPQLAKSVLGGARQQKQKAN